MRARVWRLCGVLFTTRAVASPLSSSGGNWSAPVKMFPDDSIAVVSAGTAHGVDNNLHSHPRTGASGHRFDEAARDFALR